MAEIVGIYAATHTPVLLNFPNLVAKKDRDSVYEAYRKLGSRLQATAADAMVIVTDDHLHNFFLNNLPAFCIGAANRYETPIEPWLNAEKRELRGDDRLGAYLVGEALQAGFDPAFSMDLILDHGTLTPLELAASGHSTAIVPVLVNCVQPPLPLMSRCVEFGRFLGRALRAYGGCDRVAVLATGGLSHDVGTPRMGLINETFDREFLRLLTTRNDAALIEFATNHVNEAGNGAEEVRTWLVAYGAADDAPVDIIIYRPLPGWYIGACLAEWQKASTPSAC
jgi:aromatic ring-opening dioxygenase catalytic subunit (LigB family)